MRVLVTGCAGFIGSNVAKRLVEHGHRVVGVDHLPPDGSTKIWNLAAVHYDDFFSPSDWLARLGSGRTDDIDCVVHNGAISSTLGIEPDQMYQANLAYSAHLLEYCQHQRIPLVYASSASVYGRTDKGAKAFESPRSTYALSKWLFDRKATSLQNPSAAVVGLRYFNVYGPGEYHKGSMASMAHQICRRFLQNDRVLLFGESLGYGPGEHRRDFVSVKMIADLTVHLCGWVHKNRAVHIADVGMGRALTFNQLAKSVRDQVGFGEIGYKPMPEAVKRIYQTHTEADVSTLEQFDWDPDWSGYSLEATLPSLVADVKKMIRETVE